MEGLQLLHQLIDIALSQGTRVNDRSNSYKAEEDEFSHNELVIPDWHEIEPLLRKFPDDRLKYVGNTLAVLFEGSVHPHLNRRVGVTPVLARFEL